MYVLYFKVKTYIQLRWNEFLLANGECEVKKKPQAKKVAVVIFIGTFHNICLLYTSDAADE